MHNASHITLDDLLSRPLRETAPPNWYFSVDPVCPHLLVLRLPPLLVEARNGSGLNREFKVVVVETAAELREVRGALDRPLEATPSGITFHTSVDSVGGRRSVRRVRVPMILLYHTEAEGWPTFLLTAMQDDMMDAVRGLQRGRYGYEAFSTRSEAVRVLKHYGKGIPSRARLGFTDEEIDAIAC